MTLTDGAEMPVVEVGLNEAAITDEEAAKILAEESGLTGITKDTIRNLGKLGVYMRGVGVLRQQRGQVMITQSVLNDTMKRVLEAFIAESNRKSKVRPSILRGYAQVIAQLASVKNSSQQVALDLEKAAAPTGKPDEVEAPRTKSFSPGIVIAAPEVHVHEKKELPNGG